jgi:hypothetical protein
LHTFLCHFLSSTLNFFKKWPDISLYLQACSLLNGKISTWSIPNLYTGMGVSGSEATMWKKLGFETQESNWSDGGIKAYWTPLTNEGADCCGWDNATKTKPAQYTQEILYLNVHKFNLGISFVHYSHQLITAMLIINSLVWVQQRSYSRFLRLLGKLTHHF